MTFSRMTFVTEARRWLAIAAVCVLSLPSPTAASGFYEPSSTLRLPDAVLDAAHDVAYPSGTDPVRLSDYNHSRRADNEKFVVVVATYFTGCTPGRRDYPTFTKYVTALQARVDAGDLPGNVKFVVSLKNGVNEGVARAWANLDGSDDVSGSLVIVDDRHRALVYPLFDAAVHPAYAVIDHCMRYRALLPSIAETLNGTASGANGGLGSDLTSVVEALLRETETEACPGDDAVETPVAPAGVWKVRLRVTPPFFGRVSPPPELATSQPLSNTFVACSIQIPVFGGKAFQTLTDHTGLIVTQQLFDSF